MNRGLKIAHRYRCAAEVRADCVRGVGQAPAQKCKRCHSPIVVETGLWGVFPRKFQDMPYRRSDALSEHVSFSAARHAAARAPFIPTPVALWIYEHDLTPDELKAAQ